MSAPDGAQNCLKEVFNFFYSPGLGRFNVNIKVENSICKQFFIDKKLSIENVAKIFFYSIYFSV